MWNREPMNLPDWARTMTNPLDSKMGFELLELTAERSSGRMPVEGNTQPMGLWHGGASCVLAESLASMAAFAEVGEQGRIVGVDINATHHRAVRDGWVTGVATKLFAGGRLGTWEVVLTDDAGQRVCTARVTCALLRPSRT